MRRAIVALPLAVAACAASATPKAAPEPPAAFQASLSHFGDSTLGTGCLPAGGDSTEFILAIIVDAPTIPADSVAIWLRDRPMPQNARNPNVLATLYPSGPGMVVGAGCSKAGGAVIRAIPTILHGATIALDPPYAVMVEVYGATGHLLASKRVERPAVRHTVAWVASSGP